MVFPFSHARVCVCVIDRSEIDEIDDDEWKCMNERGSLAHYMCLCAYGSDLFNRCCNMQSSHKDTYEIYLLYRRCEESEEDEKAQFFNEINKIRQCIDLLREQRTKVVSFDVKCANVISTNWCWITYNHYHYRHYERKTVLSVCVFAVFCLLCLYLCLLLVFSSPSYACIRSIASFRARRSFLLS